MTIWLDAHLPPALCDWLRETFGIEAIHVRDLGLVGAQDEEIFAAAREADAVVMTKDRDFVDILDRSGPPPRVIWIRLGNTSNENLRRVCEETLGIALELLERGEGLVEITQRGSRPARAD